MGEKEDSRVCFPCVSPTYTTVFRLLFYELRAFFCGPPVVLSLVLRRGAAGDRRLRQSRARSAEQPRLSREGKVTRVEHGLFCVCVCVCLCVCVGGAL